MIELRYGLFDADNHYYETRDAFTRHIDARYRDKAIHVVRDEQGEDVVMVGDRRFTFLTELNFETTVRPGTLRDMLRTLTEDHVLDTSVREPVQPAYVNREARLRVMDEQGIETCLLFPTLGVCVEQFMKDDVEQTYANLRAFNCWLDEDWGFDYQHRIITVPLLSLLDRDRAIEDLDWVLGRGARMVHLRAGPAFGRSPADPYFDPFWARLNEARVPVAFHIGESGYNEMISTQWGEKPNPSAYDQSAFQWCMYYGDRPIMDTVAALILHNLFGRFPNVRIFSVENGSLWVSYLLKQMDKMKGMGRKGPWLGGPVKGRPSEVFKQHVLVSPYYEENIVALAELIGPSQVVFGSDFPHCEGLEEPRDFAKGIASLPPEQIRLIMRDNARRMVGLPV